MKKRNHAIRDLIYIHLNEQDQYVMTYGIEFAEFVQTLSDSINNLLLLKHRYEHGDYNMHTMFDYVSRDKLGRLVEEDVYGYGDFCWIDFEEEEAVNELPGQAIAELLYIGHVKEHLKPPFYNYLSNRYVYLAIDDGWFNRTYYRDLNDFYRMLGEVIPGKMGQMKVEKTLLGIKKKKTYPPISRDVLLSLKPLMKEGAVLSLKDIDQNRVRIEIPIWLIGDFANMDDMYDEYESIVKEPCEAKIVFDKKTREWKIYSR
ncbi:hypothetical protein J7I93_13330 [Bacillus sp. ISL-47]|uniref:hypothetical protein n=1 Tax=Bacillus sp. ISL-47 TaxID=2819130 RepID=UPI001BE66CC7|nr:hypothetical protein [Bacillus sp. ISL-47]MBT2689169.1 hypothetical protein [Bacillus sp. ISL-47]MBT2710301.1 hypothetical protein [Pseudomonas sp. ISL-84]